MGGLCCSRLPAPEISVTRTTSHRLPEAPKRETKPLVVLPDDDHFTVSINTRNSYSVHEIYTHANVELGSGTFGSVYKAYHFRRNKLSRKPWHDVAIKKTAPTLLDREEGDLYDAKDIEKNCQEIKALIRLRESDMHKTRVLHMHEFFWKYAASGDGELTIVSELLGDELDQWRQQQTTFYESSARDIMATLMDAVQFMHEQGVVHRDLKLQNVLFQRKNDFGSLKIVDFGLAKVLDDDQLANDFCGTFGYIAPEMYKREEYGVEVDMFAMGIIMFRLLSGVRPFGSSNQDKMRLDTVNLRYMIQGECWADVSTEAIQLVRKLLIGREERMNAKEAVEHEWFQTQEESMLYSQHPYAESDKKFSLPVTPSQAPSVPSPTKDGDRFILESALEPAVKILMKRGLYKARIIDYDDTAISDIFCLEEYASSQSLPLPQYVVSRTSYTEYHCRRICKGVAKIIKLSHDNGMAHRNIHLNNFLVDLKKTTVSVRGLQYAQAVEEGRPLTGHFGYYYNWYAFKAPEVDSALYHDKSVDMWSLGALIYMLSTGLPPFRGDGVDLITNKHNGIVEFDVCILSDSAQQLIRSLLQVNPSNRLTIDEVLSSEWMTEADDVLREYDLSLGLSFLQDFEQRASTA